MSADWASSTSCISAILGMASTAWVCLHLDDAGPFLGQMFLILVDAHSKRMEFKPVSSATTIEQLSSIFATCGWRKILVTNNGSVLTNTEFKDLLSCKSAPYRLALMDLLREQYKHSKSTFKYHSMAHWRHASAVPELTQTFGIGDLVYACNFS